MKQRIEKSADWEHQIRFEDTLLFFEAAVKIIAISALAHLNRIDGRAADMITYHLAREDTLGSWVSHLTKLSMKLHRSGAEEPKLIAKWLTLREHGSCQSRFTDALRNVVELLNDPDYI